MSADLKTRRSSKLSFSAEESLQEGGDKKQKRLQRRSQERLRPSTQTQSQTAKPASARPETAQPASFSASQGGSQAQGGFRATSSEPKSKRTIADNEPLPKGSAKKQRLRQDRSQDHISPSAQIQKQGASEPALSETTQPAPFSALQGGSRAQDASLPSSAEPESLPAKAVKHRYYDTATGVTTTKLHLAQTRRPARLVFNTAAAPARFTRNTVKNKLRENDDDNSGAAALHGTEETGMTYAHTKLQKSRNRAARSKRRYSTVSSDSPQFHSNPISRAIQKRKIRRSYMQAYAGRAGSGAPGSVSQVRGFTAKAKETAKNVGKTIVRKTGKAVALLLTIGGTVTVLMTSLVSCGGMVGGAGGASELGAYAAEDEDIYAAEDAYCQMEADLQKHLDNYEAEHNFDEYHFELEEIGHDPYVLISLVSSIHEGPWTIEDVRPTLEQIFARQYELNEEVIEEVREETTEATEPTDSSPTDPPTPRPIGPTEHPQSQDDENNGGSTSNVYTVCNVTLDNFNLSHLPVYMLSENQLAQYSVYMASLGCRPDLFPNSSYVELYGAGSYTDYDLPSDALEDETFAAMMAEATKYLGYPYVWGGGSPSTSFDCSGFVCWVINHSGWNVGRLSAQGLCNICTRTSTPHPGDLVFFKGTYNTTEVSHVGIYVGNNRMLHCGDPISYADLSSSYWQQHLYCYGKLP